MIKDLPLGVPAVPGKPGDVEIGETWKPGDVNQVSLIYSGPHRRGRGTRSSGQSGGDSSGRVDMWRGGGRIGE